MAKVQNLKWQNLRVFLSIRLIFCQFQSGVANESVAYKKACIHWFNNVVEVVGQYFIFVKNEKPVKQHYLKEGASFFIPCILAHFVSFACNVSGYKQESKQDEIPSKLLRTRDQKIFFGNQ